MSATFKVDQQHYMELLVCTFMTIRMKNSFDPAKSDLSRINDFFGIVGSFELLTL